MRLMTLSTQFIKKKIKYTRMIIFYGLDLKTHKSFKFAYIINHIISTELKKTHLKIPRNEMILMIKFVIHK